MLFSTVKLFIFLIESAYILGDFFTNSSGHRPQGRGEEEDVREEGLEAGQDQVCRSQEEEEEDDEGEEDVVGFQVCSFYKIFGQTFRSSNFGQTSILK
jgi:hypothetical protein